MKVIHGLSDTKLHLVWITMRQRCNNPNSQQFKNYGGRGIKVCQPWDENFIDFYEWAISNGYKSGLSIERINNDGNYEPGNCKWATQREQTNNTRRSTKITYKGKTQSLKDWSDELNLNYHTLRSRRRLGWSTEAMIEIEMEGRGCNVHQVTNERKRRELLFD